MDAPTLHEHVVLYATAHGLAVDVVEAAARRELAWRARLDGVDADEIHTWRLTEAAASTLLDSIDYGVAQRDD